MTMTAEELRAKVQELKTLKVMADELAAEIAGIEKTIKDDMGDAEEVTCGEYKVRYTTVNSTRFDSTAFRKAEPDLYAAYTKETTTRRFSIA